LCQKPVPVHQLPVPFQKPIVGLSAGTAVEQGSIEAQRMRFGQLPTTAQTQVYDRTIIADFLKNLIVSQAEVGLQAFVQKTFRKPQRWREYKIIYVDQLGLVGIQRHAQPQVLVGDRIGVNQATIQKTGLSVGLHDIVYYAVGGLIGQEKRKGGGPSLLLFK
jgi:hypothetical protein